jgi:hypothetical protein
MPVIQYEDADDLIEDAMASNLNPVINNRKMPKFNAGGKSTFAKYG